MSNLFRSRKSTLILWLNEEDVKESFVNGLDDLSQMYPD